MPMPKKGKKGSRGKEKKEKNWTDEFFLDDKGKVLLSLSSSFSQPHTTISSRV